MNMSLVYTRTSNISNPQNVALKTVESNLINIIKYINDKFFFINDPKMA